MSNNTEKPTFDEVLALRNRCIQNAVALKPVLEIFNADVNQFYEIMRWQGVDCSEAEYGSLFENFVWHFENEHIEAAAERLLKFVSLLSQQAPASTK